MNFKRLVVALVLPQLVGLLGSVFTVSAIETWYATLVKPSFNPAGWIFGPVWTALYILMGLALYLVWNCQTKSRARKIGLIFFSGQLALNVLWSVIFFGWHNPAWAFLEIIVLWLAILMTMVYFWQVKKSAVYLLLPYILWVSFAAVLNFYLWQLN